MTSALARICLVLLAFASPPAFASWAYETTKDPMSDQAIKIARIRSANALSLGHPYTGPTRATIIVRQHPSWGLSAYLLLDQGQTMCNADCTVRIRFDDRPAQVVSGKRSSDGDNRTIFLASPKDFIGAAGSARRILVEVEMYRNGVQILTFASNDGLRWELPPDPPIGRQTTQDPEEKDALCPPQTSMATEGSCGALYAQCWLEARDFVSPIQQRFMTQCRRKGVAAALEWWKLDYERRNKDK